MIGLTNEVIWFCVILFVVFNFFLIVMILSIDRTLSRIDRNLAKLGDDLLDKRS